MGDDLVAHFLRADVAIFGEQKLHDHDRDALGAGRLNFVDPTGSGVDRIGLDLFSDIGFDFLGAAIARETWSSPIRET